MNESEFIAALRSLPLHDGARALKDDCAVIEVGAETLVITHDAMAGGTHWLAGQDLADVAWKLVVANLSDLAAKGARPEAVLLGYQLTGDDDDARFLEGLGAALSAYGVELLGGDTIAGKGPQTVALTAIGRATHTPVPSRAGARPGDEVFVAGTIGDAYAGFTLLRDAAQAGEPPSARNALPPSAHQYLRDSFTRPTPMLAEGEQLAGIVTAMMDISDGLLLDASRLAEASGVTLALASASVPFSAQFREWSNHSEDRDRALRWGDDYALLFTAPPGASLPAHCTRIGEIVERGDAALLLDGAAPGAHDHLGYTHG